MTKIIPSSFIFVGGFSMNETDFQSKLIKELELIFPGCIIAKMDSSYIQGIPDLLILYNDRWALLECKKEKNARHRPNQDYYVDILNKLSFSRFVYPENKEEVLHDLQQAFRPGRPTCVLRSK